MLYTVEIPVSADRLGDEMVQMRTWLDHLGYQAVAFRSARGFRACRIDFRNDAEAGAFAQVFAGRVLPTISVG